MKNIKYLFLSFLAAALGVSAINFKHTEPTKIEPDNVTYETVKPVQLAHPHFLSDDEDEDEEVINVDKVILHYVNEDNACPTRAFYLWATGIDGEEYSDAKASDIVSYSNDGSMMTITVDLKNDARFTGFDGKSALMYIIKFKKVSDSNLNWGGQSDDVELRYADFPPVNGVVEVWCTPAAGGGIAQFASEAETKVDGIKLAKFTDWKTIHCTTTPECQNVEWTLYAFDETYYKVKAKNREPIKKNYIVKTGTNSQKEFDIKFKYNAHINVVYSLVSKDTTKESELKKTVFVSFENLYSDPQFEQYYTYKTCGGKNQTYNPEDNDLGMTLDKANKKVTVKVWAPTAANMSLLLYQTGTPVAFAKEGYTGEDLDYIGSDKYKGYHMTYTPGGVWTVILTWENDADCPIGKYYSLQVDNINGTSVTNDPYATATGVNGARAMIYDKSATNPEGWDSFKVKDIQSPQELTVYEVHVRDFTGDSSWVSKQNNANGTYKAFVEKGTRLASDSSVTTGFDHLDELGINAVQLMPVFDQDNDESVAKIKYNWGYNPQNYNCVEGAYCSDPFKGDVRIKEFKEMVLGISKTQAQTRTIMDVVYNHVSSASSFCMAKLMPRYFFRYDEKGELYDGSGCHNEVKSEASMMRKYIVDSLYMWAKEYKIKGFRFDLMALLDVETMRKAKTVLYNVDPDIYLYGEGWTSGGFHGGFDYENQSQSVSAAACNGVGDAVYTSLYNQSNNECYLGAFNGTGRDALKGANDQGWGSVTHLPGYGFMSQGVGDAQEGTRATVGDMIWGINTGVGGNPKQTVNYASCHDNWTLRDQLYYCLGSGEHNANAYDLSHAVVATEAMIFASNGVAFMLGGEELLRSKDLAYAKPEEYEKILKNTYESMRGVEISHNSYNLPIEVNSFKWDQKVSCVVKNSGTDGANITLDMKHEDLTGKFKKMIKMHNDMKHYSFDEMNSIHTSYDSWSGLNNEQAYHGSAGIHFGEYFIFVSGRSFAYFKDSDHGMNIDPISEYCFGTQRYDSTYYSINVGDETYGTGYAFRLYRRP